MGDSKELDKTLMAHYSKEVDPRISISQTAIQGGLIQQLGNKAFLVYLVLASNMNGNGISHPSQSLIAEQSGMGVKTVRKGLDTLDSEGLISIHVKGSKQFYKLLNVSSGAYELHKDESKQQELEEELVPSIIFNNSSDVATYFAKKYEEQYGVPYSINFAREASMIKNKIYGKFSNVQIKTAIDVAIENYEDEWSNQNFPRPTISILATWLINNALAFHDINKEKDKEAVGRERVATEDDMSSEAMDLFG